MKKKKEKKDWENLKQIFEGFSGGNGDLFRPVFVHANLKPVKAQPKVLNLVSKGKFEGLFNFLIYLAKIGEGKGEKYLAKLYAGRAEDHYINLVEEVSLFPHQRKELFFFLSTPNRMFDMEGKSRMVLLFEDEPSDQNAFEIKVEIWRKSFQI